MLLHQVCLCGDGHGAVAAMKSMIEKFEAISVITNDNDIIDMLRDADKRINDIHEIKGHVVVCAGYSKIIPEQTLRDNTVINTHPSLLPKYRGLHSLVWAMLNDEPEFGFSVHLMNEEIDDGDILEQFIVQNTGQTSAEVWDEFDDFVEENLARIVIQYCEGTITATPQDIQKATWVPKRNLKDCEIDWAESNARLGALMRALVPPYPYPRLRTPKSVYAVTKAMIVERDYYCAVGRVVGHYKGAALIKSAEGLVQIESLVDIETGNNVGVLEALPLGLRLPASRA